MSLTEKYNLEMEVKILNINFQSGDVLIRFQGKYVSDSEVDYHLLQNEIQFVTKTTEDVDIGKFCLVQDKPFGTWHRGKIVNKANQKSEIALIDQGNFIKVPFSQIAFAPGDLFILPPKVVNGIISNLLPLAEKWTPRAVNFFSSLVGQQLHGNVKTFFPHQDILLEIPKIIQYSVELNLAKYVDSESFCLLVEMIHQFPTNSHCKQMPDLLKPKEICSDVTLAVPDSLSRLQKLLDHLRPKLSTNILEKIKISAAVSPNHFFCHILSWETELSKLNASMCRHYESVETGTSSSLGSFAVLCAAKRKDGLWYRGVIQKLISCNDVMIWFIDIGSSETIPSTNVQKLEPEFLSLPMMAIPCALSQDSDPMKSITNETLALFKEALMGHVIISHIMDYSSEERLYYLSLYAADFAYTSDCRLTNTQIAGFSFNPCTAIADPVIENCLNSSVPEMSTSIEMEYNEIVSYKSIKMDVESVYVAYVEYVVNPSNFWIRIDEDQKDFTAMMVGIAEKYNKCELMEMILQDPKPGQLCCALYGLDGHYYRAVVTEVFRLHISVYFIDFGNTETVPFYDIKVLLPEFSALPAFAVCCSLAYAYPADDVWVNTANDFFKETVYGNAVLCHVVAKQKCRYVVEMRLSESSESSDIVTLLVKSGFAEFWKVDLNSNSLNLSNQVSNCNTRREKPKKTIHNRHTSNEPVVPLNSLILKLKPAEPRPSFCTPASTLQTPGISTICFKQHIVKPGVVMDVKVSHVDSPASFWCQVSGNASKLSTLMEDMQKVYSSCDSVYQHGQVACAAKSLSAGKYYRAAVIKYVSAQECEVIFIDYGNTENVLVSELRQIKPQFLELEGQAFRCCLSKVFSPEYIHHKWAVNAWEDFKSLVESSDWIKCTIVALFSSGLENLFNAVNLETCFGNVNKILTNKGHLVLGKTYPILHLYTFCYSSFDLEVGSREDVYVTFIYNTGKFFCHLAKNEKTFDMLMKKVAKLGNRLKPVTNPNELCIVKHAKDRKLYRALTCPVESSSQFLAFFVDFGDSQIVKKSDLLPIPEDADDILFEPMQAIPCYLAGMRESLLTLEAKDWFEEHYVGQLLNAVVVARNNEGHMEVELYSKNISINQKIKNFNVLSVTSKEKRNVGEESSAMKNQQASDSHDSVNTLHKKANSVDQIDYVSFSWSPKLVKSVDLPPVFLDSDTTCLVYASHVDSPSSFFIQLAKQEAEVYQLVEELNQMSFQVLNERDAEKGLLVVAQYPDDGAYYRAEIKDVLQNSFSLEYIDYGNTANVDSSCIFILPEKFLNIPRLSIHAFLTGIEKLQTHTEWSNIAEIFFEKVKIEPFNCKFMCKHGTQWEVSITLEGQSLSETLIQGIELSSKPPAVITNDCLLTPDLCNINISQKNAIEDVIAEKNIHVPCSKTLKSGQVGKVRNLYFSKSGTLFVTLANFSEESTLNSQIAATVQQYHNRLSVKDIQEGMVCLVKSVKMRVWLRASVEKLMPCAVRMVVFFVDHGGHEIISMHNAKKLSSEALSIPKQAIVCKWTGTEQIGQNVFAAHLKSILQKEIKILFLEFLECTNAWKVEVLVDDVLLLKYLHSVQSSADKNLDDTNSYSEADLSSPQIPRNSLKYLEVFPGFMVSFNSPSNFFVQLMDSVNMMVTLSQLLEIQDEPNPIAEDSLKPGSSCLVQSFEEQEWCRAEIISINMNFILLLLLDYGVHKIIPLLDYKKLKMIPAKLSCLPALTYHCTLHGVKPDKGNSWSEAAISYCISFVQNHALMILSVKNLKDNIEEVCVYGQGSLASNLVKKGLAKEVDDRRKTEMIYHFPTLSLDTNRNLEDIGCSGSSACKDMLSPSRPNVHVKGRQDCTADVPLDEACVQKQ
ncbi:tudor domain-containing protein 15 isoform 1-T5 [Anomaloglossus baeobatrachus]|uniref:tudor domain-containing protein 15 n=1 Tax=Anomaloglossus baeobatrachus TaxID=238106 RepID=UPI003F509534